MARARGVTTAQRAVTQDLRCDAVKFSDPHHIARLVSVRIDPFIQIDPRPAAITAPRWPWPVGAVLEVIAVRQVENSQLWLQLANQQRLPARLLSANGREPAHGEALRLRVVANGAELVLENLTEPSLDAVLETALRRSAPQQQAPTALLANLQWLLADEDQLKALPEGVKQSLTQLWQALPEARQLLSLNSLPTTLSNAGVLLEHKLATEVANQPGSTPPSTLAREPALLPASLHQDLKAALLQLRAQLLKVNPATTHASTTPTALPDLRAPLNAMNMPAPSLHETDSSALVLSTLKAQVDGYLARIETNQLLTAQAQQQGLPSWLIEVPVRFDDHTELLRLKFEREPHQGQEASSAAWSVEVAVDMGATGMLHAQLTLHSDHGLQIKLRSNSATLVGELNQQLPLLVNALTHDGLHIDSIHCLHGLPLRAAGPASSTLLDIRA